MPRGLLLFSTCLALLLALVPGLCWLALTAGDDEHSPLKQETPSPAQLGFVALLEENRPFLFSGTTIWLFVWDRSVSSDPIRFDIFASDGQDKWERGVWSRDGSVFAIEAHLGVGSGKNLEKDFGAFFVSAYDFRNHRRVPPHKQSVSARVLSKQIEHLLRQRGGQGASAFTQPYMKLGKPLTPKEQTKYGVLDGWN